MAAEKPTIIARGNSGIVFFPSLPSTDGFDTTGYVSKIVTLEDAQQEMRNAELIHELLPDCSVYPEHMCRSNTVIESKDTLLFSRYRGKSLDAYIPDYLEYLYYTGKPSKYYRGEIIPLHFFKDMLSAIKVLYTKIQELNKKGYYHNDLQQENIVYDVSDQKSYLIDFEKLSKEPFDKKITDLDTMKGLIDTLTKYISGIELVKDKSVKEGGKKTKKRKQYFVI